MRAWRYREGVPSPEDVDCKIDIPTPETDELLWIDCDRPSAADLEVLAKQLNLHEFVLEDLQQGEQRTKLDQYAEHFHVAVHDCQLQGEIDQPAAEIALVTREIDVVFGDNWLLSVRQPADDDEGENFQDAPNVGWVSGFAIIVGLITVLCVPLYVYFKRRNWL